jgi:D-alanyl-D-alanine carboxypeptidase
MVPGLAVGPVVAALHRRTYAPGPMEAFRRRQRLHHGGPGDATPPRQPDRRTLPRVAAFAAALAILAAVALAPVSGSPTVSAVGPLPACRYDDILTSPRGYGHWHVTLVDTILRVPRTYVPPDLVSVKEAGIAGSGQVRAILIDDLREMSAAAAAADAAIGVQSAYRSYERQEVVFDGWVAFHGYDRALQLSARPGHSEHQLGLAIDFRSDPGGSPFVGTTWAKTAAGRWMKAHAWEYGFVLSYPKGMLDVVCYDFEPWHFRYVGRDLAAHIQASGLTLREYLWANYTTTVVPAVTPRPARSPRPSREPAATSTVAPSPSPTVAPATPPATPVPASPAPSSAPSAPPSAAPAPTPMASPGAASGDDVGTQAAVIGGLALALVGAIVTGWMVLRRGRS